MYVRLSVMMGMTARCRVRSETGLTCTHFAHEVLLYTCVFKIRPPATPDIQHIYMYNVYKSRTLDSDV